jgi:outer membrane protein
MTFSRATAWLGTTLAAALLSTTAFSADLSAKAYKGAAPVVDPLSPIYIHVGGFLGLLSPNITSMTPAVVSPGATASTIGTLGFDVGYFVTDNIAVSLGAGIPPSVTTYGQGGLAAFGALGSSTIAPAMLTAHYHLTSLGPFQPYIGGGVVWNIVLSDGSLGLANYHLNSSVGAVLQAGVDLYIDRHWGLYGDVKKVFLTSNITSTSAGGVNAQVDLNPWFLTAGVTYRF